MPDPNNVAAPTQPSPSMAQSLLAQQQGQDAQLDAQGPMPTAPTPVQQNTSKWANIMQTVLAGLSGGLRGIGEDMGTQGTGRPMQTNGGAYAQQNIDKEQAQQKAAVDQQNQQAQQQFENALQQRQLTQREIMNRAQLTAAHLSAYKTAQEIDQQPVDIQNAHFAAEDARMKAHDAAMQQPLGTYNSVNDLVSDLSSKGKSLADIDPIHHRNADGSESVIAYPMHDSLHEAPEIQKMLTNPDDKVPEGIKMTTPDMIKYVKDRNSKYADALGTQRAEKAKLDQQEAATKQLEQMREGSDARIEGMRESVKKSRGVGTGQPGDPMAPEELEKRADDIANGNLTPNEAASGMGNNASDYKRKLVGVLRDKYPGIDNKSLEVTGAQLKQRDLARNSMHNLELIQTALHDDPSLLGKINGRWTQGLLNTGTNDTKLAAVETALDNYGLASTGAHGIRSTEAREDAKRAILNHFKNGQQAVDSAINTAHSSLQDLASIGMPRRNDGTLYKAAKKMYIGKKEYTLSGPVLDSFLKDHPEATENAR